MEIIKASGLTKYYGKSRGVENLDLVVEKGDFFGFVGPNGAGKSTFIRILMGYIMHNAGEISVFGEPVNRDNLNRIGYVPSEINIYSSLKVKDAIKLSADLRKTDCLEEGYLLADRIKLDLNRKVRELSLGNRKKVGIVCALQHKPELYVLDELTSGLDPLIQLEIFEILNERNKEGATVFLSSHNLAEVKKYCKKAAIIREGSIIVSDSVSVLSHTGAKRVSLAGCGELPENINIRDVVHDGDTVKFLYSGEVKELMQMLGNMSFSDITVSDPELDEIFMHYYSGEAR